MLVGVVLSSSILGAEQPTDFSVENVKSSYGVEVYCCTRSADLFERVGSSVFEVSLQAEHSDA